MSKEKDYAGIYSLSVITSAGYPYREILLHQIPIDIELHLRFFDLSNVKSQTENFEQSFELFAGLISALTEFAKMLNHKLELLKFRTYQNSSDEEIPFGEPRLLRNRFYPIETLPDSDCLLNVQAESFIENEALECKIFIIFEKVIKNKLPLGPHIPFTDEDEKFCIEILDDKKARDKITLISEELRKIIIKILVELQSYGLKAIVITSFDYTPIKAFGIEMEDVYSLFRDIGKLPAVETYQWKYRRGKIGNSPRWVYVINSGVGVRVEDVFMAYHYCLICTPESYLGEKPHEIYQKLNEIIDID